VAGVIRERPDEERLRELGVERWSSWECEPSTFDWEYDSDETFYVHEGKVRVTYPGGSIEFGPGDLVTFPRGMKCTWHVEKKISKVFTFDSVN